MMTSLSARQLSSSESHWHPLSLSLSLSLSLTHSLRETLPRTLMVNFHPHSPPSICRHPSLNQQWCKQRQRQRQRPRKRQIEREREKRERERERQRGKKERERERLRLAEEDSDTARQGVSWAVTYHPPEVMRVFSLRPCLEIPVSPWRIQNPPAPENPRKLLKIYNSAHPRPVLKNAEKLVNNYSKCDC